MKLHLESTSKIVGLVAESGVVPARIWEGTTESGIPVICYVTRVAVRHDRDCTEFERELLETRKPTADADAIPLRLIL